MSDGILVKSESISEQLIAFQEEMGKLDKLMNKIDNETTSIKSNWEGNASDNTLSEIEKFKQVFESIKSQNEKYCLNNCGNDLFLAMPRNDTIYLFPILIDETVSTTYILVLLADDSPIVGVHH